MPQVIEMTNLIDAFETLIKQVKNKDLKAVYTGQLILLRHMDGKVADEDTGLVYMAYQYLGAMREYAAKMGAAQDVINRVNDTVQEIMPGAPKIVLH